MELVVKSTTILSKRANKRPLGTLLNVGIEVGMAVGADVGIAVGIALGAELGTYVGAPDGWLVGNPEGLPDGSEVGAPEGRLENEEEIVYTVEEGRTCVYIHSRRGCYISEHQ